MMNASQNNHRDDALILIQRRNDFYKKKFFLALIIYLFSIVAILILAGVIFYLTRNPSGPLYFVTDKVGRFIQDIPRELPIMTSEERANWVTEAIESAFSYDYVNFRTELQNAQKYFTEYGWKNYMQGLKATNNLIALTQRKYVIIAKVVSIPKVIGEGIVGGARAWKFQLPLLITYRFPPFDEKSKFENPVILTVVVQRQSILTSYKGLGIMQVIATFAKPNQVAS